MGRKYEKTFLTSVLIRADFSSKVNEFRDDGGFREKLVKMFPIPEERIVPRVGTLLKTSPDGAEIVHSHHENLNEHLYHAKDRRKTLRILDDAFWIEYKTYDTFDVLLQDFTGVLAVLKETSPRLSFRRLGLRYINDVVLPPTGKPTNWTGYLNSKLLGTLSFSPDESVVARAFNVLTHNYRDFMLNFQFGLFNQDFPASIRRRSFILDFDAYIEDFLLENEVLGRFKQMHDRIEELFELSITNKLRSVMHERS